MRHYLTVHTSVKAVRFITNYLFPPPKRVVLAHLGIPLATGEPVKDEDRIPIVRKAEVDVSVFLGWLHVCGPWQAPSRAYRPLRLSDRV